MDRQEARRIYRSLASELEDAEKRTAALRKLVEGLMELYPGLDRPTAGAGTYISHSHSNGGGRGRKPTRQEAIRRVLNETPWLTTRDLTELLVRRNWAPRSDNPEDGVRTVANRMLKAGDLTRRQNQEGVFEYAVAPPQAKFEMSDAPEGASDRTDQGGHSGPP